jgi:A/G-specific adenine glycosylase
MAEVPGGAWTEAKATTAAPPLAADWVALAAPVEHGFTHFELRLSVRRADVDAATPAPENHWWAAAGSLGEEALPSLMKKVIEAAFPGATRPAKRES